MNRTHSAVKKDSGLIVHIAWGIMSALVTAFVMSIVLTVLVEKEMIALDAVPIAVSIVHTICVFAGSMLSISLEKGRIATVAGIVTAGYLLIMALVNMLVFSNGFSGVVTGLISAAIGGAIGMLVEGKRMKRNKKYRKRRTG